MPPKKKTTAPTKTTPVEAATISKADRVRKYMEENPKASPREVAKALEKYGVVAQYVSLVKMKDKN